MHAGTLEGEARPRRPEDITWTKTTEKTARGTKGKHFIFFESLHHVKTALGVRHHHYCPWIGGRRRQYSFIRRDPTRDNTWYDSSICTSFKASHPPSAQIKQPKPQPLIIHNLGLNISHCYVLIAARLPRHTTTTLLHTTTTIYRTKFPIENDRVLRAAHKWL